MRRLYTFPKPIGFITCTLPDGAIATLPVFVGLLKHASQDELFELLKRYNVARKYTIEALKIAPWQMLYHFPREWLLQTMQSANLSPQRQRALEFLLSE